MMLADVDMMTSFNSRTREGCDTFISQSSSYNLSFNSRTREGCDGLL